MENIYLKGLRKHPEAEKQAGYPFAVPVIQQLDTLEFRVPVTILCGDNGCGKTTLMELLAAKLSAVRISEAFPATEKTSVFLEAERYFTLWTGVRAKKQFYFSAEEFIQYIKWIEREKVDARESIARIEVEYAGKSQAARDLAKEPYYDTLSSLNQLYGVSLARQSHGQGYLEFFSSRLAPRGLYLMDEPESALSYENQYVLALMILRAVRQGCQFVLSTHSPVLTAIPGADILEIHEGELMHCEYADLDNIRFLALFLSKRDQMFDDKLVEDA